MAALQTGMVNKGSSGSGIVGGMMAKQKARNQEAMNKTVMSQNRALAAGYGAKAPAPKVRPPATPDKYAKARKAINRANKKGFLGF